MMNVQVAVERAWPQVSPREAGFDPTLLEAAVAAAEANESQWPRSMYTEDGVFIGSAYVNDKPPYNQPLGPVFERGGANGLILRGGSLVASWGNTSQVDMTFSIAKSYLAILAGLAVDRGLIRSIGDRVGDYVADGGFSDPHNAPITWRHLLEQTSEWRGVLFDRPDSVDWNRQVGPKTDNRQKGSDRTIHAPGEHYEYNDVRVNRLALSLLRVFRQPLPEVLRGAMMDPLGASDTWRWNGYDNSYVDIDGRQMQSVTGGGHWGGGIIISARDHARVGELILNRGRAAGRQLLSESWVDAMLTPSGANKQYGLLWWLNTDGALYPSAPASSVFALGGGQNMIWVDRPRDLVVVVRWLHKPFTDELLGMITRAIAE
jgi:CubicO group peptidase (beta-lactamase class C family)